MSILQPNRGLGFPVTRLTGELFVSRSPLDTAWSDLMMAVLTQRGTRAMARQLGSELVRFLFEPDVKENESIIEQIVIDIASKWTPQVRILRVQVESTGEGRVELGIAFSLSTGETDTRTVEVNRDHLLQEVRV